MLQIAAAEPNEKAKHVSVNHVCSEWQLEVKAIEVTGTAALQRRLPKLLVSLLAGNAYGAALNWSDKSSLAKQERYHEGDRALLS